MQVSIHINLTTGPVSDLRGTQHQDTQHHISALLSVYLQACMHQHQLATSSLTEAPVLATHWNPSQKSRTGSLPSLSANFLKPPARRMHSAWSLRRRRSRSRDRSRLGLKSGRPRRGNGAVSRAGLGLRDRLRRRLRNWVKRSCSSPYP